jgi:hypothetical protein
MDMCKMTNAVARVDHVLQSLRVPLERNCSLAGWREVANRLQWYGLLLVYYLLLTASYPKKSFSLSSLIQKKGRSLSLAGWLAEQLRT